MCNTCTITGREYLKAEKASWEAYMASRKHSQRHSDYLLALIGPLEAYDKARANCKDKLPPASHRVNFP